MTDRAGRTPLHYAALEGDVPGVRELLAAGLDPGAEDEQGFTPLHFAAQALHADVAAVLLEAGAGVDPVNVFGATPLLTALTNVRDRPGEVIVVLMGAGADPDRKNKAGVSPRSLAARVANFDLQRFFRNA